MSSSETTLDEVVDCAQLPACTCWMQTKPFTSGNLHLVRIAAIERSLLSPTCVSGKLRTVHVLVVVAAEGLAVDQRESAAMTRMMPGAAEVMPEASPVPLL